MTDMTAGKAFDALLNGVPVKTLAFDGKTMVRAWDIVRAMGMTLTKQQADTKFKGSTMAAIIDGKWWVTFPNGMRRLILNRSRPYTAEGMRWKRAVQDCAPYTLQLVAPPIQPPKPAASKISIVPEQLVDGAEAAIVVKALQEQLALEKARGMVLATMLAEQARTGAVPKPTVPAPFKSLRNTLKQLVRSFAAKKIYDRGWDRLDPRARDMYERVWAELYSEFFARTGINYRARFHNLTADERRELGVSSAIDLVAADGRLEEFYATAHELCPVSRLRAMFELPQAIQMAEYDGGQSSPRQAATQEPACAKQQSLF